jgi:hypothetical protein
LQRARDNNAPVSAEAPVSSESDDDSAAATAAGSGTRGSLVSLQLSMATYFKREVAASAPAGQ